MLVMQPVYREPKAPFKRRFCCPKAAPVGSHSELVCHPAVGNNKQPTRVCLSRLCNTKQPTRVCNELSELLLISPRAEAPSGWHDSYPLLSWLAVYMFPETPPHRDPIM